MNVFENGYKHRNNYLYETKLNQSYDYKSNGLLKHLLSNKLLSSSNPIVQNIIKAVDKEVCFILKAVDHLRYFKDVLRYNR